MTVFGGYELERRLGAGGMGEVFLARRLADGLNVVVKRVLPGLASQPGFAERFLHEVRVLARLAHPHIVRVIDFGEVDGRWFLAMEHVEGVDVATLCARGPLPLAQAVRIGLDGAAALRAAHEAREASGRASPIVHRDVSPHNLLVAADGAVKLIDFGVASLKGQGDAGGKLAYAAPEQLLEDETSPASDQYSLGVVLWECLGGRPAFDAEEDVEVIRLVTEVGVPPLPATVPAGLRELVARMTALDPRARYASLAEVHEALSREARALGLASRGAASTSQVVLAPVAEAAVAPKLALTDLETAALATVKDGMSAEQAELAIDAAALPGQPFALDLLQTLLEKGALRAIDRDGDRRFVRA